jgi:CheY-like chemotaxis protein/HPt (histidine-containing phosphotransfer) domain-containing protein
VVEDNVINQQVARLQIESLGYQVSVAANGHEALAALAHAAYALVLMDCQMPEMDGFETTAAIRAREGTQRHTPIIALTANAFADERERCLQVGMDDYLTKPVKPEALAAVLEHWLTPVVAAHVQSASALSAEPAWQESLDNSTLAYLRELQTGEGEILLPKLIELFLKETSDRLACLRKALVEKEAEQIYQVAHMVKGSSSVLGATQMTALCLELEKQGRTAELSQSAACLRQLEEEYQRVCALLALV